MKLLHKIVLVFCLAGLLVGCKKDGDKPSTARDFRLDTLSHDRFYLNQQRGKVVVLAFWATWCRFCKGEMIELKSFADIPGAENLVVAAVCTDPENINNVRKIVKTLGVDYPVLLDRGQKVARSYRISTLPTTIVIDQAGYIRLTSRGYSPAIMRRIKAKVKSVLASNGSEK